MAWRASSVSAEVVPSGGLPTRPVTTLVYTWTQPPDVSLVSHTSEHSAAPPPPRPPPPVAFSHHVTPSLSHLSTLCLLCLLSLPSHPLLLPSSLHHPSLFSPYTPHPLPHASSHTQSWRVSRVNNVVSISEDTDSVTSHVCACPEEPRPTREGRKRWVFAGRRTGTTARQTSRSAASFAGMLTKTKWTATQLEFGSNRLAQRPVRNPQIPLEKDHL